MKCAGIVVFVTEAEVFPIKGMTSGSMLATPTGQLNTAVCAHFKLQRRIDKLLIFLVQQNACPFVSKHRIEPLIQIRLNHLSLFMI